LNHYPIILIGIRVSLAYFIPSHDKNGCFGYFLEAKLEKRFLLFEINLRLKGAPLLNWNFAGRTNGD